MLQIGLLSDTHGFLDPLAREALRECDEIWHAGDLGSAEVAEALRALAPLRAVYGNIDDAGMRREFTEDLRFECGALRVMMTHIGGYPGRYAPRVRPLLQADPPDLFVCGHSHILRIVPDGKLGLLHLNPGACGNEGFHEFKTLLRLAVEGGRLRHVEVVDLGPRGSRAGPVTVKRIVMP